MGTVRTFGDRQTVIIRLTALWALNEAGLGGLLHLFRSPFTGIFVGGSAVLLIALIARWSERPLEAVPRALLLVLIIKGVVSPHSPLPAYVAVSFQGLLGAVLFQVIPSFRLAALLLGLLALLEAALQKLLVTTLLFGMPLWESLDAFIDYVLQKFGLLAEGGEVQGSLWVVGLYVGVYAVSGLFIGWLAGRLPAEVEAASDRLSLPKEKEGETAELEGASIRIPFWRRATFRWISLVLVFLLLIYWLSPAARQVLAPLWLLARVVGITGFWFLVISPLLTRLLRRFLQKKATRYQEEVAAALDLLPIFRHLSRSAWRETGHLQGWRRWRELVVRIITYALLYSKPK